MFSHRQQCERFADEARWAECVERSFALVEAAAHRPEDIGTER